jgi:hypothetical protein
MKYVCLCPEVAGGMGKHTIIDRIKQPGTVQKLHYEFQGWDGDYLLKTSPCFVVAEPLANRIREARLTGCSFDVVEVSKSAEFRAFTKAPVLPRFLWLKVDGQPGMDDLGLGESSRLIVSERALAVIKEYPLNNCDIYDADKVPSFEERQRQIVEDAYRRMGRNPPESFPKKK